MKGQSTEVVESTGDISNLGPAQVSNLGETVTFKSDHVPSINLPSNNPQVNENESSSNEESDEEEPVAIKEFSVDLNAGS